MKRISSIFLALLVTMLWLQSVPPHVAAATPAKGGIFPDLTLPLPQKAEERQYLMIKKGPFHLSQIKSEILIIEIFSMYCPYCQKEAPNVNELFRALSARPDLKSRVKIIGIGAGNDQFEVDAFRNRYRIRFPLIPDKKFHFTGPLSVYYTPYFFVLWNRPSAFGRVVYSKVGSIGDPQQFLDLIAARTNSGEKKLPGEKKESKR